MADKEIDNLLAEQQRTIANHEKRIRELEKIAKIGEQKVTQLIQEWNKQQREFARAMRNR